MAAQPDAASATRVDEAIVQVLTAERSARAAVAQYASEAERIRETGRARAHAIAERAAERVARVHRWTDGAINARISQLNAERAALRTTADADPDEPAKIDRALDRLAAELSGCTP